ncbi:MoaD/ThiS family protein [Pseudoduganella sp. R-34]|uniref:MoaD/ThiS family protein n=1 Tax=Pseudoduganella sp. R-34 TaxID=3404062 RepID=UPI003CEA29D1
MSQPIIPADACGAVEFNTLDFCLNMPVLYTPDHPQFEMPDLRELVENPGFASEATTLGGLLEEYESSTGFCFALHDPPKYFRYFGNDFKPEFILVDIHVMRNGIEICPKQALDFPLEPNDVVEAGVLIC